MSTFSLSNKCGFRLTIGAVLTAITAMSASAQPQASPQARARQERLNPLQSYRQQSYFSLMETPTANEHSLQSHEDPFGRAAWLRMQRSYPFLTVPPNARNAAKMQADVDQRILRANSDKMEANAANLFKLTLPTWTPIGPTSVESYGEKMRPTSGRVNCIAISPVDEKLVLIGAATGGIWRSENGGQIFKVVTDDQADLAVGSIAFAPSDSRIVYAGMGDYVDGYYGTGVLKSTDAGLHWHEVSNCTLPTPGTVSKILVDAHDPQRVYLAQSAYRDPQNAGFGYWSGFYYSQDGGVTWNGRLGGRPTDLVTSPDGQALYLAMSVGQDDTHTAGLYTSSDGTDWTSIYHPAYTTAVDMRVAVTPAAPGNIYLLSGVADANNKVSEVYLVIGTGSGAAWGTPKPLKTKMDIGQFGYNTVLAVSPVNPQTIYIGTRDLWKSIDGGDSWANLTNNYVLKAGSYQFSFDTGIAHSDQHALVFIKSGSDEFLLANDGGVYRSSNEGRSYASLNATLAITQMNSIAIRAEDATLIFGGSQDNGGVRRSTSDEWSEFESGDSGYTVFDPNDKHGLFTTYVRGQIDHFADDGRTHVGATSNVDFGETSDPPRIGFYAPFTVDSSTRTFYFGTWRLFKSSDGVKWSLTSNSDLTMQALHPIDQDKDVLSAIGVGPPNSHVLYTGSAYGRVMFSEKAGSSWSDVTSNLPQRFIQSITVDPQDAKVVYVTVGGFHSGHVFLKNGNIAGKASDQWIDISANLPDLPVKALAIDPNNSNILYVGTDLGVWVSTDRKQPWRYLSDDLPPVIVTGIVATREGTLRISTYGRGAYELKRLGAL